MSSTAEELYSAYDLICTGLYAAMDNARDMRIEKDVAYALEQIKADIFRGSPDSYPDSGYLQTIYACTEMRADGSQSRPNSYTRGELRKHYPAAEAAVLRQINKDRKGAKS